MSARPFEYSPAPTPEDLLLTYPDLDPSFVAAYASAHEFTMTSPERMYALWQAVHHVVDRQVPGAFVECGVWRGGSSMLVAHALLERRETCREMCLYDTFSGMPDPGEGEVDFTGRSAAEQLRGGRGGSDDLVGMCVARGGAGQHETDRLLR